jgi:hypothetical protein
VVHDEVPVQIFDCCSTVMLRRTSTVICRIPARNFGLSHVDERTGTPVMVDVSHKTASVRVAHAQVGDQYNDTASFEKVDYAYSFPSIGNG